MPTYEKAIMQEARTLARLQSTRRKLRAELKKVEADIRLQKRQLNKVVRAMQAESWQESGAASKVFDVEPGGKV